jgi:UDP-N-acetylmuramoylalanine--D-glutamate ligase
VIEVSSFQLEAAPSFRPDVAVILNVTPDHMDRHGNFRSYAETKLSILKNQSASDMAVLNLEDPTLSGLDQSIRAETFWFSNRREVDDGTGFNGEQLVFKKRGNREVIVPGKSVLLRGSHNLENVAAAVTASRLAGASASGINAAISRFEGVEHRLERVTEIEGVMFYNDSKATNVDATIKALLAFDSGVILILGGRDKGGDYSVLGPLVRQRVKAIVLLGEASGKIQSQLEGIVPIHRVTSMQEAVKTGFKLSDRGETVLLAPACASFDMFLNYEARGRAFKEAVNSLRVVNARGVNE